MSAGTRLLAIVGTVLAVFVLPYILAMLGLAPNGTETLLLVVLLWSGTWAYSRRASPRRSPDIPDHGP